MTKRKITILLIVIVILNIIDVSATLLWIDLGIATEANPMLELCLKQSIWIFALVKMSIVGAYSYITWRFKTDKLAQKGIYIAITVYSILSFYHGFIGLLHLGIL